MQYRHSETLTNILCSASCLAWWALRHRRRTWTSIFKPSSQHSACRRRRCISKIDKYSGRLLSTSSPPGDNTTTLLAVVSPLGGNLSKIKREKVRISSCEWVAHLHRNTFACFSVNILCRFKGRMRPRGWNKFKLFPSPLPSSNRELNSSRLLTEW